MNGLSAVGMEVSVPVYPETTGPDIKLSPRMVLASGKTDSSRTVAVITTGTSSKYHASREVNSNKKDKYTEKRTTAFSDARTGIEGCGTNLYQVSWLNRILGSEYQKGSFISYFEPRVFCSCFLCSRAKILARRASGWFERICSALFPVVLPLSSPNTA